jgi:large subunit ribosomal protein L19
MTEKKQVKKKTQKRGILRAFEQRQLELSKKKISRIKTGDTVRVHAKIKEGEKERVQIFEGVVMRLAKGGHRSTITVRKLSFGVGVERTFPLFSPTVDRIEQISQGKVRRSRLYYLRDKKGKSARIESVLTDGNESVVESMGTVASGPALDKDVAEKKSSAAVEANAHKG